VRMAHVAARGPLCEIVNANYRMAHDSLSFLPGRRSKKLSVHPRSRPYWILVIGTNICKNRSW
jgi:hypothetical protein